jgi:L-arabinokinase
MWRIDRSSSYDLPDLARFLGALNQQGDFFQPGAPIVVARAPGRLDVMGGIADYSGALVLELPLAAATFAAAQATSDARMSVRSLDAPSSDAAPEVSLPIEALLPGGRPIGYAEAHALLAADPARAWAAYVIGCLVALGREHGLRPDGGLRLLIASDVPAGKGVSSSAAIEVAAMRALCGLYDIAIGGRELALLCQKVENLVVGAPCGVMDQMTAACGAQDRLLALLCQPAELQEPVALPPDVELWGVDSGIRHAVTGADYSSVRIGAFMGYRIVAGLAVSSRHPDAVPADDWRPTTGDLPWGGYLANLSPSEWEQRYRQRVPETLDGATFLARYGATTDPVTRVDPSRAYAVRQPTAHPIYEHQRVRLFRALLESLNADDRRRMVDNNIASSIVHRPSSIVSEERYILLGELMFQSHASYSACGLGSDGTERLVELVRGVGPSAGLYGAKITGGGSGGTVAVLARRGSLDAVRAVAAQYERETGRAAAILGGSSPGAVAFGVLWLRHE